MNASLQTITERALSYLDEAARYALDDRDEVRHVVLVAGRARVATIGYTSERFVKVLHDAGFTPQRVTVALRSVEHPELPALRKQVAQMLRLIAATKLADNIENRERCDDVKVAGQLVAYQVAKGFGTPYHDEAMRLLQKTADSLGYRTSFDNAVTKTIERVKRKS